DAWQPDWWGSDRYETPYYPLERTGLFREFGDLEPTEKSIVDFANQFGLLGRGGNFALMTESGKTEVRAEALAVWKEEIQSLKLAIAIWDHLSSAAGDPRVIRDELQKLNQPLAIRRRLHIDDDDPLMAPLSVVQRSVDSHLSQHTRPRLLFQSNAPRL